MGSAKAQSQGTLGTDHGLSMQDPVDQSCKRTD